MTFLQPMETREMDKYPRKQRSISATDPEWNGIKRIAEELDIPVSQLIIERVLRGRGQDPSPIAHNMVMNDEVVRELLLLSTIARENLEKRDELNRLKAIEERVERRMLILGR